MNGIVNLRSDNVKCTAENCKNSWKETETDKEVLRRNN